MYLFAKENHLFLAAKGTRPQLFAHAVGGNHLLGQVGSIFKVLGSASGHLIEYDLLGQPAAHRDGYLGLELGIGGNIAVFSGQLLGITASHAAGNNGYLVNRVGLGQHFGHQGMPGLMIGGDLFFMGTDLATLALWPGNNTVDRFFQVDHFNNLLAAAGRQDSALIHQIRQVGAGKPDGLLSQGFQINIRRQRLAFGMNHKDLMSAMKIRHIQHYTAVKTAGAKQCRVQHIRPVGGSNNNHGGSGFKTVHLHQYLV